ncbi:MAG: hypothetical protein NDF54_10510 [archaeon GB-1867-035]|nr:hypothetical protein [Candidatus Culexmicrobium profundum]
MPACWSSIIYKLTFKQLFDKSDLVAIVEVIGVPITYGCWQGNYYDPYFSLYKAKIIEILKGNVSMNYIYLYLWGGYDPKYNVFLIIEGYPVFKLDDEWLLFMNKITYDRNLNVELPENTYRFVEIASLKLIEGRLYSMDNFGNKIVEDLSNLKVKGLTIEEFKTKHLSG